MLYNVQGGSCLDARHDGEAHVMTVGSRMMGRLTALFLEIPIKLLKIDLFYI